MLQQTLTYYVSSSTAALTNDNALQQVYYNVQYEISGSEFETSTPGGFESTVATIRINIISGSTLIASFPYDQTNLIIDSSSGKYTIAPPSDILLQYTTNLIGVPSDPSFYFLIENSSSLAEIVNVGVADGTNTVNITETSSNAYNITFNTKPSTYNSLYIYDANDSLIFSTTKTASYGVTTTLYPTSSTFYYIKAAASGSSCCAPILTSVTAISKSQLQFTWEDGGCGINYAGTRFYKSTDQTNWALFTSSLQYSGSVTSSIGTYPTQSLYFAARKRCGPLEKDFSDYSNIVYFQVPSCLSITFHNPFPSDTTTLYYTKCDGTATTASISPGDPDISDCVNTNFSISIISGSCSITDECFS